MKWTNFLYEKRVGIPNNLVEPLFVTPAGSPLLDLNTQQKFLVHNKQDRNTDSEGPWHS